MELKFQNQPQANCQYTVLIVPLWNWNMPAPIRVAKTALSFNRTFMELKFLGRGSHISGNQRFNRTFMELKFLTVFAVPWTINSFNRTFMELKFASGSPLTQSHPGFNRTFMELKYLFRSFVRISIHVLIVPLWNWNGRRLRSYLPHAMF